MIERELQAITNSRYNKGIAECNNKELYYALLELTKGSIQSNKKHKNGRKLYYISAEFLIGKLLSNHLINLGLFDEVNKILCKYQKKLTEIEEVEPEPSLGNGGLGRLAACFLDSIATLGLNADGIGLNYHFGLFKQEFDNNLQIETINPWIQPVSWLNKTNRTYQVVFKDFTATSILYEMDVTGYHNGSNKLRLFDIQTLDESIVKNGIIFDKEKIAKNLTLFLYPDDSDEQGLLLRIYQQYFMVSNAAQLILDECREESYDLRKLHEYVVIQINDTHPSLIIPELIRLLTAEGISIDEAIGIVSKTCAYTNHTILAEALEKWPLAYLEQVVPHLVPIINELDARVKEKYEDLSVAIIDKDNRVHMAHMDIHYGFSVNGVAALHTKILKEEELKAFYKLYPEKFNNKTNGITFRRWLLHCNQPLAQYIEQLIGDGFKTDAAKLEQLLQYKDNKEVLLSIERIKQENKAVLKDYLMETQGIEIDVNSIFDIQIKRLHEYKRQQMNALYIIYKYLEVKKGNLPKKKITMIFGAKAAPAYTIAKDIIHLLLCLQELIDHDPEVNPYLKVVMVENYNVTKASKLIPACDISEQISLASKEASGTGNMKFMLNGAVTLGTEDGANVEIHQLVQDDNIYIFGKKSEEVIEHYRKADYVSRVYYEEDALIHELVEFILSRDMLLIGEKRNLVRLYNELINKDWFMTLLDIKDYIKTKDQMLEDYMDRQSFNRKALINIAKAGYFSSDRTIQQYNEDIWRL
ncbi:glycogen/starch/alpha-glucan phosphorylase [Lachnotalea glycerini]|uniref:Alpha-1,4 glucan phosphorylase n=1 Tax=Lachnotalea glycerini TaxID=1763509 RepID=A0A371JHH5_9FIRM|nr:glycogen/starch/alpha-glucan phosphorylase [Lachnotalea glycerini]RDY32192.1 glycogen/starch/alpha-glucan family phosphorylase [Lachnotalea glycerini]